MRRSRDPRSVLRSAATLLVLLTGCDKTSKICFEGEAGRPVHEQISACGELCEKDDQKACGEMTELALAACTEKHDRESCAWMCNYSSAGNKEFFCDELAKLPEPKLTP